MEECLSRHCQVSPATAIQVASCLVGCPRAGSQLKLLQCRREAGWQGAIQCIAAQLQVQQGRECGTFAPRWWYSPYAKQLQVISLHAP